MNHCVKRTRICILESLRPGDRRTGDELYRLLLPKANTDPASIGVGYCNASDRVTFESALREVADWSRGGEVDPAVHVEAHAGGVGLQLGDMSIVPWPEFGEMLLPINEA